MRVVNAFLQLVERRLLSLRDPRQLYKARKGTASANRQAVVDQTQGMFVIAASAHPQRAKSWLDRGRPRGRPAQDAIANSAGFCSVLFSTSFSTSPAKQWH